MLLAIDVGNTQTVLGIYSGIDLTQHWRVASVEERTSDEWALLVRSLLEMAGLGVPDITGLALASGVPRVTQSLRDMSVKYFHCEPLVLEPGVRTGMPILYENAKEVGADRIADAVAALELYGGPVIVIDFGTATVFDAITERGEYLGGAICPGMQVSASALFSVVAAGLKRVPFVAPESAIGRSSAQALQSGIVLGTVELVEGMIRRFRQELGSEATTIATGGLAEIVVDQCPSIQHHEPWLTLHGLRIVYEKVSLG